MQLRAGAETLCGARGRRVAFSPFAGMPVRGRDIARRDTRTAVPPAYVRWGTSLDEQSAYTRGRWEKSPANSGWPRRIARRAILHSATAASAQTLRRRVPHSPPTARVCSHTTALGALPTKESAQSSSSHFNPATRHLSTGSGARIIRMQRSMPSNMPGSALMSASDAVSNTAGSTREASA